MISDAVFLAKKKKKGRILMMLLGSYVTARELRQHYEDAVIRASVLAAAL